MKSALSWEQSQIKKRKLQINIPTVTQHTKINKYTTLTEWKGKKNQRIISTDTEKVFGKIPHKIPHTLGTEGKHRRVLLCCASLHCTLKTVLPPRPKLKVCEHGIMWVPECHFPTALAAYMSLFHFGNSYNYFRLLHHYYSLYGHL